MQFFIDFFTIFLKTSPASGGLRPRNPSRGDRLTSPPLVDLASPPRKIPAGANVNNVFFAIFLRNLFKIFENFLKMSKEFVFFVQTPKNWMLGLLNFLKNKLKKAIFSIFVMKFFENFLKIFLQKCSPAPKKSWLRPCC